MCMYMVSLEKSQSDTRDFASPQPDDVLTKFDWAATLELANFWSGNYCEKKVLSLTFCDVFVLCADISLVWVPSAQHQPPVHRPSCINSAIIPEGDLHQIAFLIYKERLLQIKKSYK